MCLTFAPAFPRSGFRSQTQNRIFQSLNRSMPRAPSQVPRAPAQVSLAQSEPAQECAEVSPPAAFWLRRERWRLPVAAVTSPAHWCQPLPIAAQPALWRLVPAS